MQLQQAALQPLIQALLLPACCWMVAGLQVYQCCSEPLVDPGGLAPESWLGCRNCSGLRHQVTSQGSAEHHGGGYCSITVVAVAVSLIFHRNVDVLSMRGSDLHLG